MRKNIEIINKKYKMFYIIFAFINGSFASITSGGDLGMMPILVLFLIFSFLIAIFHGYVTYAKIHSFFIPHLCFYISWVVSLLPLMFLLPTEDIDDLIDIFKMASIFLLISCIGALIAKIVMIIKRTNISKVSEIISKVEETTSSDTDSD